MYVTGPLIQDKLSLSIDGNFQGMTKVTLSVEKGKNLVQVSLRRK